MATQREAGPVAAWGAGIPCEPLAEECWQRGDSSRVPADRSRAAGSSVPASGLAHLGRPGTRHPRGCRLWQRPPLCCHPPQRGSGCRLPAQAHEAHGERWRRFGGGRPGQSMAPRGHRVLPTAAPGRVNPSWVCGPIRRRNSEGAALSPSPPSFWGASFWQARVPPVGWRRWW